MNIVFHGANAQTFMTGFAKLLDRDHNIQYVPDILSEKSDQEIFSAADVLIGTRFDASMPALDSLRLYHAPSAGYDAIDLSVLPANSAFCNCFGHENAIAEYVMAALLARHVPLADADKRLRQGDWKYWAGGPSGLRTELGSSTIGILGYGHIGQTLALRAKAFGLAVHVANRSEVAAKEPVDRAYPLTDLRAFMGSADIIVATLPLTAETRSLINQNALSAMRPDAVIMNVGRGEVIDEIALFECLKNNDIGGAILDTWYIYPQSESPNPLPSKFPFHELNNVVMTPHMSGWTIGTIQRRKETIAENINRMEFGSGFINQIQ